MKFFGEDVNAQKIVMLKNIPIFHQLTRHELLEVDQLLHERVYEKDEIIFEAGDPGHGIFIIVSGRLRVQACPELLKTTLLDFGPGELMGELSLFDEAERMATVVALERTVTVALFQAEFSALLQKNKNIGVKVLVEIARILSRRARQLLQRELRPPSL